ERKRRSGVGQGAGPHCEWHSQSVPGSQRNRGGSKRGNRNMTTNGGFDAWVAEFEAARKRDADFVTQSSSEVEPLYTPRDLATQDYQRDLGYPGAFPFTRGVHPTMYRGKLWTMRQFAGFGTAED